MQQKLTVNTQASVGRISKHIYGHFAEHLGRGIYGGIWVGEDSPIENVKGIRRDVIDALRRLRVPVLRWPGGCFADEYHWKDGVGPRNSRRRMVNTHWGGGVEHNQFGTHEFLTLCELLGCEPYISGNVGSGTVQEMQEWVEYINFDGASPMTEWRRENGRDEPWSLKYFGVGNESWGCGGNMRPEYYADVYRRYQTFVRNYRNQRIYKIACGASDGNLQWTEVLMSEAKEYMDGLSLHYYTIPGTFSDKGSATDFEEDAWFTTMKKALLMDDLLYNHSIIMDKYDPDKRIGLIVDEWGTWFDVEPDTNPGYLYQQNTLRDALVAAISLNIFNHHCHRVHMANIAQTVNVLQSMILTSEDAMVLTPTYHVFDMYQVHQDAQLLEIHYDTDSYRHREETIPGVHASASRDDEGRVHVTICRLNPNDSCEFALELDRVPKSVAGTILTADDMQVHNTFEDPSAVVPKPFTDITLAGTKVTVTLPPKSVILLTMPVVE